MHFFLYSTHLPFFKTLLRLNFNYAEQELFAKKGNNPCLVEKSPEPSFSLDEKNSSKNNHEWLRI